MKSKTCLKYFLSMIVALLSRDNIVSIHHQNLPGVATDMYTVKHKLAPDILNGIFGQK